MCSSDLLLIVENIFVEDVVSVTGTLIWEGGISPRPAVRVTLQRAGLIEPLTNLYTVTIPDGVTSYTWQNLLKVDPLGNPYSYRMVLAEPLSTYRAEENGLSIMLNYTSELRSLSAKIYWRGGPDAIRPKNKPAAAPEWESLRRTGRYSRIGRAGRDGERGDLGGRSGDR